MRLYDKETGLALLSDRGQSAKGGQPASQDSAGRASADASGSASGSTVDSRS
jgi:hypothetical protein